MKGLGETSHIPLPGLLNLVIISWFMFGHELHNYLLYFNVFFIIQHVFSVKGGDTFSSLYKGGENLQLLGRTMGKIRKCSRH